MYLLLNIMITKLTFTLSGISRHRQFWSCIGPLVFLLAKSYLELFGFTIFLLEHTLKRIVRNKLDSYVLLQGNRCKTRHNVTIMLYGFKTYFNRLSKFKFLLPVFGFPSFRFWVYLMKNIQETRRVH